MEAFRLTGATYRTPSTKLRILSLLRFLLGDTITDEELKEEYRALRANVRGVFLKMVLAQQKLMNDRGQSIRLKSWTLKWSQYDNRIKQEYALKTEKKARDTGLNIFRCKEKWSALLLLSDICRNIRTNHAKKVKTAHQKALESGSLRQPTGTGSSSESGSGSDGSESDDDSDSDSDSERALPEEPSSSSSSSSSAPPPKKTKVYRVTFYLSILNNNIFTLKVAKKNNRNKG